MADNYTANAGSGGDTFAADDVAGVKYPRVKLAVGADGVNDGDVSATNPMPTKAASDDPVATGIGAVADAAASAGGVGSVSAKLRLVTSQLAALAGYFDGVEGSLSSIDGKVATETTLASIATLITALNGYVDGLEAGVGATADAAVTAGSAGSLSAKLRLMTTQLATLLSQTDGVETSLSAIDSKLGSALPLPTGAATETTLASVGTLLTTQNTYLDGLEGGLGAAADAAATAGGTGSVTAKLRLLTSQIASLLTQTDGLEDGIGASADVAATAGGAGSISAKLRLATSQLATLLTQTDGIEGSLTSIDGKVATETTLAAIQTLLTTLNTYADGLEGGLGAAADAAASVGGAGSLTAKLRLVTSQLDAIGATGDGAATQGATGTISAKLRTVTSQLNTLSGYLDNVETLLGGVATEASLSAQSAKLPASLGAKASSGSLSVTPATDAVQVAASISANPSANFSRPADTTAYASGDLVANNTTAGSVTPLAFTAARVAAGSFLVHRVKLAKSGTSITNTLFRLHLFTASPTVANGDNGAISMTGVASYLGYVDVAIDQAFTDGAAGFSSIGMNDMVVKLGAGQTIYGLLEARAAYTPASGETFTVTLDVVQD